MLTLAVYTKYHLTTVIAKITLTLNLEVIEWLNIEASSRLGLVSIKLSVREEHKPPLSPVLDVLT